MIVVNGDSEKGEEKDTKAESSPKTKPTKSRADKKST